MASGLFERMKPAPPPAGADLIVPWQLICSWMALGRRPILPLGTAFIFFYGRKKADMGGCRRRLGGLRRGARGTRHGARGAGQKEARTGTVRQLAGEDACLTGEGFGFRAGELFSVRAHTLGKRGNATRRNGGKGLQTKRNGGGCPGHRGGKMGCPRMPRMARINLEWGERPEARGTRREGGSRPTPGQGTRPTGWEHPPCRPGALTGRCERISASMGNFRRPAEQVTEPRGCPPVFDRAGRQR